MNMETFEQVVKIATPANGHHNITNSIFQNERPANNPGNQFTK